MEKIEALAKFLNVKVDDIEEENYKHYELEVYSVNGSEYAIGTDEEADKACYEYCKDTAWAFNRDFIIWHSEALDMDEASYKIIEAIQEQCENGNEAILKLIDVFDDFVEDAISADGRGHFLASYNGEENETEEYFIYQIN